MTDQVLRDAPTWPMEYQCCVRFDAESVEDAADVLDRLSTAAAVDREFLGGWGESAASADARDDALRMACRELTVRRHRWWGLFPYLDQAPEADVDDVVAEFIDKARGFPPEGSEGASP